MTTAQLHTMTTSGAIDDIDIVEARIELAAAFRWFARLNMHESVANHLSVAVSADGSRFLMNPRGRHFARIRASDLLLLDANDKATTSRPDAPDPTAWFIHARLHAVLPQARCVMHLHPKYAPALSALDDSSMPPIDQNTMRFYGRVAADEHASFQRKFGLSVSSPRIDQYRSFQFAAQEGVRRNAPGGDALGIGVQ